MKQRYTQLTQEERYCLYTMSKQANSLRAIAKAMGRSHTTLSRELKRNIGQKGSRHDQAQRLAERRHQEKPKAVQLTETVRTYLHETLQAWWSPEHIRGRLQLEESLSISPTTLYRFVLKNKHRGPALSWLTPPSKASTQALWGQG